MKRVILLVLQSKGVKRAAPHWRARAISVAQAQITEWIIPAIQHQHFAANDLMKAPGMWRQTSETVVYGQNVCDVILVGSQYHACQVCGVETVHEIWTG